MQPDLRLKGVSINKDILKTYCGTYLLQKDYKINVAMDGIDLQISTPEKKNIRAIAQNKNGGSYE